MKETERGDEIRDLLRVYGLRYSRPREVILEVFRDGNNHVSAENLHHSLKGRGEDVSLSTVYLNLGVLRDAGLIKEFRGVGGEALYDYNISPHYHLICRETGQVVDVPAIEIDGVPLGRYLRERVERETGWTIEEPRVELRGVSPGAKAHGDGPDHGSDLSSDSGLGSDIGPSSDTGQDSDTDLVTGSDHRSSTSGKPKSDSSRNPSR